MKKWIVSLLFLSSCGPNSLEEYQKEGEALTRNLVHILQGVHSREELVSLAPLLEKQFEKFVDIIIEARLHQIAHPEDASLYDSLESERLREEMERVYALEGARETIERAQREPLLRLDAFEKKLSQRLDLLKHN